MQDPQYEFRVAGIYDIATGELLPEDEPILVLRASNTHARAVIGTMAGLVADEDFKANTLARLNDFQDFAAQHPDRVHEPTLGD